MIRRKEREFALKVLYANAFNDINLEDQIGYLKQSEPEYDTEFSKELILICDNNKKELDEQIAAKLKHWDFNRVAIVDRLLLRIALAEFLFFEDIPPKVTIDEIIEISKDYSTEKSNKFINGVLDALLKGLQTENKLKKSGRGLV